MDLSNDKYTVWPRCPVAYDPDAKAPLWNRFLAEVFEPNPEAAEFVRRFAGYSLTGDTSAQCMLFAQGNGCNGKSVLFRVMERLLGPGYSARMPSRMFAHGRSAGQNEQVLFELLWRRAVFIDDVQPDRIAEHFVKSLLGGDPMTARAPCGRRFTYVPRCKLWMASNESPRTIGAGLQRRIIVVPFKVSFADRCDADLVDRLCEQLPGILTWAVRGCRDWLADGGGVEGLGDFGTNAAIG